jgi:hypothetical protein
LYCRTKILPHPNRIVYCFVYVTHFAIGSGDPRCFIGTGRNPKAESKLSLTLNGQLYCHCQTRNGVFYKTISAASGVSVEMLGIAKRTTITNELGLVGFKSNRDKGAGVEYH